MIFSSFRILNDYYTCEVKNTSKGIEISNVKEKGRTAPRKAEEIRNQLLSNLKQPYSKIDTSTKEGRKELSKELQQKIKSLEQEIKATKLAVQMCKKNNVFFK